MSGHIFSLKRTLIWGSLKIILRNTDSFTLLYIYLMEEISGISLIKLKKPLYVVPSERQIPLPKLTSVRS